MTITRDELVLLTRQQADAVGSDRWDDPEILRMLNWVYDSEWGRILQAAPYYRFQTIPLTTDVNGRFTLASLNTGTGDAARLCFRVITLHDGNVQYQEVRYQDVPLGTIGSFSPVYRKMFYLAGEEYQVLPVVSTTLTAVVNYQPQSILGLASGSSIVVFPENNEYIVACETAARMLLKGGAESQAAADLMKLAANERLEMLDIIRRKSINPTRMAYPDNPADWAG